MPLVQLSLDAGLDPSSTSRSVGRALPPLRDEGVLIIGSGSRSYDVRTMLGASSRDPSRRFDAWLQQTLVEASPDDRVELLLRWEHAPCPRAAHPREDHLIPLMVAVGAAETGPGAAVFHQTDLYGRVTAWSFRFGTLPSARTPAMGR